MIIRKEQMQAMTDRSTENYVRDVEPKLRELYPDKFSSWSQHQAQENLRELANEASHYGLRTAPPLTRFIEYRLEYGETFPNGREWEWALELLERQDLDEENKIAEIDRAVVGGPLWDVAPPYTRET
jgi:hypothetical protein